VLFTRPLVNERVFISLFNTQTLNALVKITAAITIDNHNSM